MSKKEGQIIHFEPTVCYSLNPEEYSDMCTDADINCMQVFENFGK